MMEIALPRHKTYIVAVSGGVDSMVLIDLLIKHQSQNNWQLIVAHVNHGIRHDSALDEALVKQVAEVNQLIFESINLKLKATASESLARAKRYQFLEEIKLKYQAAAIITAHHQDDFIETAILNLIRGTGRKGLSSLKNNDLRLRPLINYPKSEIIKYAKANHLVWHEDYTNKDQHYLRNYIRINLLPKFDASARLQFISILNNLSVINRQLDYDLSQFVSANIIEEGLDRSWFILLPHCLSREVLATWLRSNNLSGFSNQILERLTVSAKVARVNQRFPIYQNRYLIINKTTLSLS